MVRKVDAQYFVPGAPYELPGSWIERADVRRRIAAFIFEHAPPTAVPPLVTDTWLTTTFPASPRSAALGQVTLDVCRAWSTEADALHHSWATWPTALDRYQSYLR